MVFWFKTVTENLPKLYTLVNRDKKYVLAILQSPNIIISHMFLSDKAKETTKPVIESVMGEHASKQIEPQIESQDKNKRDSYGTSFIVFGIGFSIIGGLVIYTFGQPTIGEDGHIVKDEFSNMPLWKQYIYRTLRELDYYTRLIKEPSRDKLLPDVMKFPYYQPPYTLILEMTDVLVHPEWTYKTGWRFRKRPGVEYFLENLQGIYEIVVFTAEQGMTVFPIIEALDPKNCISYKLVRDATHFVDGVHIKDLSKLNRDLSKVIVVDWNPESVKFHQENVFQVPRWDGRDDDNTLVDLVAFLKTIAHTEINDVREVLKYYKEFDNPLHTFRMKQLELLEKMEAETKKVKQPMNKFLKPEIH